jgi:prepilin-type N-terminal cleavage/methylation domain-containing protein
METRRGFTLVEVMIVVVIIGIITAIAVPRFNITAHRSKEKEAELILKQVYEMQEAYRANTGSYAAAVEQLRTVGFAEPSAARHYVWAGSVVLPLCLSSTGPHPGRRIDENGDISNC